MQRVSLNFLSWLCHLYSKYPSGDMFGGVLANV